MDANQLESWVKDLAKANTPTVSSLIAILRQASVLATNLQAEVKRLEEENRWIPVSERLPKEKGYISVADAKLQIPQTWYWTNTNDEAHRLKAFYTHWKPVILPKETQTNAKG